jgi:hypothetical protein
MAVHPWYIITPMWWHGVGLAGMPWEHRPSSSEPRVVPMGRSRFGQNIKDEPCAKHRALLGIPLAVPEAFLEDTRSCVHFFLVHL